MVGSVAAGSGFAAFPRLAGLAGRVLAGLAGRGLRDLLAESLAELAGRGLAGRPGGVAARPSQAPAGDFVFQARCAALCCLCSVVLLCCCSQICVCFWFFFDLKR